MNRQKEIMENIQEYDSDDILQSSTANIILKLEPNYDSDEENIYKPPDDFVPTPKQEITFITFFDDPTMYEIPSRKSKSARYSWKQAKISFFATPREIEMKLLDWAFNNAYLEIKDGVITKIKWRIHNGIVCSGTWNSFIRWILCSSIRYTN
jgi:hypothetical protein